MTPEHKVRRPHMPRLLPSWTIVIFTHYPTLPAADVAKSLSWKSQSVPTLPYPTQPQGDCLREDRQQRGPVSWEGLSLINTPQRPQSQGEWRNRNRQFSSPGKRIICIAPCRRLCRSTLSPALRSSRPYPLTRPGRPGWKHNSKGRQACLSSVLQASLCPQVTTSLAGTWRSSVEDSPALVVQGRGGPSQDGCLAKGCHVEREPPGGALSSFRGWRESADPEGCLRDVGISTEKGRWGNSRGQRQGRASAKRMEEQSGL